MTGYHGFYGRRPLSDWGEGDTRAEYAEGDVVYIAPDTACVLDKGRVETGPGVYRVVSVFSIGEDASFYYRVSRMEPTGRGDRWRTDWDRVSGRVHVIPGACDFTAGWVLLHRAVPPP